MAAYTFLCAESAYGIDTVSAGMGSVQTLKANATVCNRSSFEVALNTCQDTSFLFLLVILTKAATQETTMEAHTAQQEPPAPQQTGSSAGSLVYFFIKEQQSPSYKHIHFPDHATL